MVGASDQIRVVTVVLNSGKEQILDNPYGYLTLDGVDYQLKTAMDTIDSFAPAVDGGLEVTFNNGERMTVRKISGDITFRGDFGDVKLPASSIRKLSTVKNTSARKQDRSFDRDYYKEMAKLRFGSGETSIVYLAPSDLVISGKYKQLKVQIDPGKASMEFDWPRGMVRAHAPSGQTEEFVETSTPAAMPRVHTDLGMITFAWQRLVASELVQKNSESFERKWAVQLADGTEVAASDLHVPHRYSARPDCLLDGRKTEVFWDNVEAITPAEQDSSAKVTFSDRTEHSVLTDGFVVNWTFGTLDLPLNRATVSRISWAGPKREKLPGPRQRLRLADGTELAGGVSKIHQATVTTAEPMVLHLVEFDVPLGTWLAEADTLDLTVSDGRVTVNGLGLAMLAKDGALKSGLEIKTAYGEMEVDHADIRAIQAVRPQTADKPRRRVSMTLRNGDKHELMCATVEFVRYPDRLYSGTRYNQELGAWFWRRSDKIAVRTAESTIDVELGKVRVLKLSGDYPSWDVELTSAKSGTVLTGKIVAGEVADQKKNWGGVASWDKAREGFWFASPGSRSFLFVPAAAVAEIDMTPAPLP